MALFEDEGLRERAASDPDWVALIGSARAFPESLAKSDEIADRILEEPLFRQSILRRSQYAKALFEDEALREHAVSDPEWVSLIGTAKAFPESLASNEKIVNRILSSKAFQSRAKDNSSLQSAMCRDRESFDSLFRLSLDEKHFENNADTLLQILQSDLFLSCLTDNIENIDKLLEYNRASNYISNHSRIISALLENDNAISLLSSDDPTAFFDRILSSSDFHDALLIESKLLKNLVELEPFAEQFLDTQIERFSSRIAKNLKIIKSLLDDPELIALFQNVSKTKLFDVVSGSPSFHHYLSNHPASLRAIIQQDSIASKIASNTILIKEIGSRYALVVKVLRNVQNKGKFLSLPDFVDALEMHKHTSSLHQNNSLVNNLITGTNIFELLDSQNISNLLSSIVKYRNRENLLAQVDENEIADIIEFFVYELNSRSTRWSTSKNELEDATPQGMLSTLLIASLTHDTIDKLFFMLSQDKPSLDISSRRLRQSIDNAFRLRPELNKSIGAYFSKRPDLILESLENENLIKLATRKSKFVGKLALTDAAYNQITRNNLFLERLLRDQESLTYIKTQNRLNILLKKSFACFFYNDPQAFKVITHNRLMGKFLISNPKRKSTKEIKSFSYRLTQLDHLLSRLSKWFDPQLFEPEYVSRFLYTASAAKDNLWIHLASFLAPENRLRLKNGLLEVPNSSCIRILINEIFLEEEYKFISEEKSPRILDVGAHVGLATYYFKSIYPKAKIICYEPDPHNFEILERNVQSLGFREVETRNEAVSNIEGKCTFYTNKKDSMAGSLLKTGAQSKGRNQINVKTVKFNEIIDEPTHFLKLDIEGSEHKVIKSSGPNGFANVENIFCEFHHKTRRSSKYLAEINHILTASGYYVEHSPSFSQKDKPPRAFGSKFRSYSSSIRAQK